MNSSIVLELDYDDFEIVRDVIYKEQFQSNNEKYIGKIKEIHETLMRQSKWNINQRDEK